MERHINLNISQHNEIFRRKDSIQSRFKIQIETPVSCDFTQPNPFIYNGFNPNEIFIISVKGEASNVEAFQKYVLEAFVQPEIVEFFTYLAHLESIFGSRLWIDVFEEICGVCINIQPDCELNISGTDSSVSSAVSLMKELTLKYSKCKDMLLLNEETSLAPKLVTALRICRSTEVSLDSFDGIPNDVIRFLLSLLERACGENFPVLDSPSLEDSVVILDSPEKKKDISVIILDSDDDVNSRRKKKKRMHSRTRRKNGIPKKCRPLLSSQNLPDENAKVASTREANQPIIDNSNFIPLSLNTNDSAGQAEQRKAVRPGSSVVAEIVEEPIPEPPRRLRPIVIDGCNVALYNTNRNYEQFSWKRIEICVEYFLNRGHTNVKVLLSRSTQGLCYKKCGNKSHVDNLVSKEQIIFTPSRTVDGKRMPCYDDRFIVDLAYRTGGVILSNDHYKDITPEKEEWANTVKQSSHFVEQKKN